MASLVMRWNLFQGTTNHQKVQQSKIEGEKLKELYSETQQQIRLEVINHYYALQAAYESVQSAQKQTRSANRAYELISRKYSEGQSSLLELIDARTSLTSAAANSIIAQSEYFSQQADFEYAMGANSPGKLPIEIHENNTAYPLPSSCWLQWQDAHQQTRKRAVRDQTHKGQDLNLRSHEMYKIPVRATGLLSTTTEMKLSFKTGGIIKQINVREGRSVRRGEVLAVLDLSEVKAQVNQARIGL